MECAETLVPALSSSDCPREIPGAGRHGDCAHLLGEKSRIYASSQRKLTEVPPWLLRVNFSARGSRIYGTTPSEATTDQQFYSKTGCISNFSAGIFFLPV